jgi:hypothetical protein
MYRTSQTQLLRLAAKVLKYFSLVVAGCILAYILSMVFSVPFLATLVVLFLKHIASRVFVLVVCFVVIAIVVESIH